MPVPNQVMNVLLYVFNFMCLLMVFLSVASVTFGNNFLNMYQGIMLPSLPVSILHGTVSLLSPACISNDAISIDWFLFICRELILAVSLLPFLYSWDVSCSISFITLLLLLWQTFLKCPTLPHTAHILPYTGHCLSWCILPQYLPSCLCIVWLLGFLVVSSFVFF